MKIINNNIAIFTSGDKDNMPIIFIHGFPYDHLMWKNQIEAAQKEYYCITYDIRGMGSSPAGDGQYTIESFADDLDDVMNYFQLNKPILCGLSMGGYISLRAVEKMEHKLGGLILCDTKSEADTDEGKLKRALAIKNINKHGSEKFTDEFVKNCFWKKSPEKLGEKFIKILARSCATSSVGLKGCLLAMAARTNTTSYLSKINIPTLVLCGEHDSLTTPEAMKSMAKKIRTAEFYIVPKAGHITPIENPDFFNKRMIDFLKKHFG